MEAALEEKEKEWREVHEAVEAAEDKLVASIQEKSRLQVKLFRKLRRLYNLKYCRLNLRSLRRNIPMISMLK